MREAARLVVVVLLALAAGAVTSPLQTVLPDGVRSFANSAGPWTAVAFVLAGLPRTRAVAVSAGGLALVGLVAGYYVASDLRGFGVSATSVAYWTTLAVTVGPALGWSRHRLRGRPGRGRGLAVGLLPGVLVGEAVVAWSTVRSTTSGAYWVAEGVVGLLLLAVLARRHRLARGEVALAPVVLASALLALGALVALDPLAW